METNNRPFIMARMNNGRVETQGEHTCTLGHKLPGPGPDMPDGIFAEWEFKDGVLTVRCDYFGFYPLYYYYDDDCVVVSPSIAKIMPFCKKRDLDEEALAVFYRLGTLLGNDTHFKHIKAFGPNAVLTWNKGKFSYCEGEYIFPKSAKISPEEAKAEYKRLFAKAIAKRAPKAGKTIVPVSGGRDSRNIILELLRQNIPVDYCVTFEDCPDWRGEDQPVAEALLKVAGVKHVILKQDRPRFEQEVRKNIITDLCASRHVKMMPLADHLNENARTSYDGIGGLLVQSFLMKGNDISLYSEGQIDKLVRSLLSRWTSGEETYSLVLNGEFARRINYEKAFEHLKQELLRHRESPNPVVSFHFWNRQRRDINLIPYCLMSKVPNVYSPYIDIELALFLLSLPVEIMTARQMQDETIRESYPKFAHIPFEDKDVPNPEAPDFWARFARDFSKYYLRKGALRSKLLNTGFLLPRILRCLADGRYARKMKWLSLVRLLAILQLEEMMNS